MMSDPSAKLALVEDELAQLGANLNYISHLGPLSVEHISPAKGKSDLDQAADIKLYQILSQSPAHNISPAINIYKSPNKKPK